MREAAATALAAPDKEALEWAAAAARLGGFERCLLLRSEGATLWEYPSSDDGLRLPVDGSFSGRCLSGARAQFADSAGDALHPRERAVLRGCNADYWVALPVLAASGEPSGVVVGLRRTPLGVGTGEQERLMLSLLAEHLALIWRNADLEQALLAARERRRELEAESAGLLQSFRTAALVLTPDHHIEAANQAAAGLLGFELASARGELLTTAAKHQAIAELITTVDATGGGELPAVTLGDEAKTAVELRIHPVFDSRGELRRRVVVIEDTTRQKQADALKTEFVMMISHELRTPLTSIKAFASTLLRDDLGSLADQREWLQIIDRECDRLTALVNDLLAISRLESGQKLPMQFTEFDLVPLLREVVAAQREHATKHSFELALPERLTAEADAEKVRQIFANLVNNAVKYSPRGGCVTVAAAERGAQVEISVRDEGVGIRVEHLDLIFEKFFQVDGSSTRRVGGTGLGLYLTRRLVEAHEGRIWVESEPGAGSTFVVALPRRRHVRDRLGT
ncbi:MAG: PAS domain-containing protein [Fimbriimonadaceae bacterium]|nr:PAS domain-containing protein [Fimbriimonadaceae bacterium]